LPGNVTWPGTRRSVDCGRALVKASESRSKTVARPTRSRTSRCLGRFSFMEGEFLTNFSLCQGELRTAGEPPHPVNRRSSVWERSRVTRGLCVNHAGRPLHRAHSRRPPDVSPVPSRAARLAGGPRGWRLRTPQGHRNVAGRRPFRARSSAPRRHSFLVALLVLVTRANPGNLRVIADVAVQELVSLDEISWALFDAIVCPSSGADDASRGRFRTRHSAAEAEHESAFWR
jgi:hypothetical protein